MSCRLAFIYDGNGDNEQNINKQMVLLDNFESVDQAIKKA